MTELINETFLEENVRTLSNKSKPSTDCDKTMLQFFYSKKNLFYHVKDNMTIHELSQWLISLKSYLYRKSISFNFSVPQREEVLVDFGFAYGNELAYLHHAIVLRKANDKFFIVPLSTSREPFKKEKNSSGSYVYKLNNNGDKILDPSYHIGMRTEGFTKDKVIVLLDDARWISKNRVIKRLNHKITESFFDELKKLVLNRAIPSLAQKFESNESEIIKLRNSVNALNDQIELRNATIDNKNVIISRLTNQLDSIANSSPDSSCNDANVITSDD